MIDETKLANLERNRRRIWGLCYRMTGDRAAADDLAQESIARAIERAAQSSEDTFEAWLFRVATTTCLDWLRRRQVEARAVALVDPVDLIDRPFTEGADAEGTLVRREDVRLAILTCMQNLTPHQRAVLILRDVLDRSTEETAAALGVTSGSVKVLLHRARAKLAEVHRVGPCDSPVDANAVEVFAQALEARDIERLTAILAANVWGLIDDGIGRRQPTIGLRAVSRQWQNAMARYSPADRVRRVRLNGEPSLLVLIGDMALASIHFETRDQRVVSTRVLLDPPRLARLGLAS
jgi:RNA polymerase sigma-70 factor (ECF subfamily)